MHNESVVKQLTNKQFRHSASSYVPSNGTQYEGVLCYGNQFRDLDLASMCVVAVCGGVVWRGRHNKQEGDSIF